MQSCAALRRFTFLALVSALSAAHAAFAQSTTIISLNTGGVSIQNGSAYFAVSRDARYVAFRAKSPELPWAHQAGDVYRYDSVTQTLQLISTAPSSEIQGPAISADGRYVAYGDFFSAAGVNWGQIYVVDANNGTTVMASVDANLAPGNSVSSGGKLSADGRLVVFSTVSTNLVPNDTTPWPDVVVRDLSTNTSTLVSVTPGGVAGHSSSLAPEISDDGRWVLFQSAANDLVANDTNGSSDVFLRDLSNGVTTLVSLDAFGQQVPAAGIEPVVALSPDGRFAAFSASNAFVPSDTNFMRDVYLRDLWLGTLERISVGTDGTQPNGHCQDPSISSDGRFVAFRTLATNLALPDANGTASDIYVRDRKLGTSTRSNVSSAGVQSNLSAISPQMIGTARTVAFWSSANNLVPGETQANAFAHDPGPVVGYCTAKVNSQGCTPAIGFSGTPSVSSATPCLVSASQVLSQKSGVFLYGYDASIAPFQGGWLCVKAPLKRTPVQNSGGNPPTDCSGAFVFDLNAYIQSGADPMLGVGVEIFGQYWYRDPLSSGAAGLSDALSITLQP